MTSPNYETYKIEILKKLEKFKSAKDWSDFIEPLDSLCGVFKSNKCGSIPCIPQLVKRLNQLMNPALPAGIHMKTIECYHSILDCIDQKHLEEDFDALTIGLFSFSLHCRILVADEYLNLLEKIISKLGANVECFSKHIILGILPFLDSESSEFYNRAYLLLISFINQISEKAFYSALWRNFVDYPDLRVGIFNFMNNYKLVVITDYSLVTHAMCCGLKDSNPFIIRSILEISNRDFPYVIDTNKMNEDAEEPIADRIANKDGNVSEVKVDLEKSEDEIENIKREDYSSKVSETTSSKNKNEFNKSSENLAVDDMDIINIKNEKTLDSVASSEQSTSNMNSSFQLEKIETQKIRDLAILSDSSSLKILNEKEKCNTNLIHHILNIFLMKEVGINKRAYKWLNLGDQITEKDVEYLERGLRTYLDGTNQNLCLFYRIINSLSDKENLVGFLIDRLIIDALRATMNSSHKKDPEGFANLKKIAKNFLNHSIDDFYSSMYIKLSKSFEILNEIDLNELDVEITENSENSDSSDLVYKVDNNISTNNFNLADELIKIILFCIETIEVVDQNAISIHIPLLCHVIIKNKRKINNSSVSKFFKLFCKLCGENAENNVKIFNNSDSSPTREIKSEEIDLFYEKTNGSELLELNLIGAIAKELSKISIYKESTLDHMHWTNSNLVEQDGILIWSESKDLEYFVRNSGGFFNFSENDLDIIRLFINTFGYFDLDKTFIKILCRFFCFNYKYIDMLIILSSFIDKTLLYINVWNDFIISKNPKFINFFPEDELHPVIHSVFPSANIEDICLFLTETLSHGKFIDILFRTATVANPESPSFVNLILDLEDPLPLVKYMLETFYHHQEKINDYQYVTAILYILQILIDCKSFITHCKNHEKIKISNLGEIEIDEGISKMISQILVDESRKIDEIKEIRRCSKRLSAIVDFDGHLINGKSQLSYSNELSNSSLLNNQNKGSNISMDKNKIQGKSDKNVLFDSSNNSPQAKRFFDNHPIVDYNNIEVGASNLIERHSIHMEKETIYKLGFNCLYKMHKKDIKVTVVDNVGIKTVICESKNDFYILKRSVFLVEKDFHFIFENYMHFYKQILNEISEMSIKNDFLTFLADPKTICSVEVFTEAFSYFVQVKTIKNEDLFLKANSLMTTRAKKGGLLYKRFKNSYRMVLFAQGSSSKFNEISRENTNLDTLSDSSNLEKSYKVEDSTIIFRNNVSEQFVAKFDPTLPPLVMLSNENLSPVLQLAELLYSRTPSLFVSSFRQNEDSFFLFAILPFKIDLFVKLLAVYKQIKFPLNILYIFLQNIPYDSRSEIIKKEVELIKSNFAIGEQDAIAQRFVVELFKNQQPTDLSRIVLQHLLNLYELKIDQVIKLSYNFDIEISLMKKLANIPMKDSTLITSYKNCCYNLLQSRTYREKALQIIYSYIKTNSNCKIFIDQFVIYFSRNFFTFGLATKKNILELISSSSCFDPFLAINNAFSGMDSSFFMSAQSEELLKINSLKKISFLVLSQPRNKYSVMADEFVILINSYINSTSDIKYEIIRLCIILMFKIDNHFLTTLYPILVADLMNSVDLKDIRVLGEIFKFVDLSIWLNSPVFDFKALFVEKHNFREKLLTKLFNEKYEKRSVDMNATKLPNFITRTIKTFSDWSDFSYFLREMPKYYRYKENCMIENDYDAVESNLIESFLDFK